MAVKIIDPTPDPSVVKNVICKNCGAKLSYTPKDIETRVSSMGDDINVFKFITCPSCNNEIERGSR